MQPCIALLFVMMLIFFPNLDTQFTILAQQKFHRFWVIFTLAFRQKEAENLPIIDEWFIRQF